MTKKRGKVKTIKKKKEENASENRSTAPQVAHDQPDAVKEAIHQQLFQEGSALCKTQTKDADLPCKGAFCNNMFQRRPLLGFHPCEISLNAMRKLKHNQITSFVVSDNHCVKANFLDYSQVRLIGFNCL